MALPLPGSPSASWALYRERIATILARPETPVVIAFWLSGLINNVLYVIILCAAQDLVGDVPKGVVLLADVAPAFILKLFAPYFIHRVPYSTRIIIFTFLSTWGMLTVALTPTNTSSVFAKLSGVMLASLSSGGGEITFLAMTHFYGHASLAGWGGGTGAAGLAGAGLYVTLTHWLGLTVRNSLLTAACLPAGMLITFLVILPREPLQRAENNARWKATRESIALLEVQEHSDLSFDNGMNHSNLQDSLGSKDSLLQSLDDPLDSGSYDDKSIRIAGRKNVTTAHAPLKISNVQTNWRRTKALLVPYMLPLLIVYIAEYCVNQGISPVLLFPLEDTPFTAYREFYPFYTFLYQLGVFVSRSSTPFYRIHALYTAAFFQVGNFVILTLQSLFFFMPSVRLVFIIIFWQGLIGGAVYVNAFAKILEEVPASDREFSLGIASVSDSAGICLAGLIGIVLETHICAWQVGQGRDWCRNIETLHH